MGTVERTFCNLLAAAPQFGLRGLPLSCKMVTHWRINPRQLQRMCPCNLASVLQHRPAVTLLPPRWMKSTSSPSWFLKTLAVLFLDYGVALNFLAGGGNRCSPRHWFVIGFGYRVINPSFHPFSRLTTDTALLSRCDTSDAGIPHTMTFVFVCKVLRRPSSTNFIHLVVDNTVRITWQKS